MTTGHEIDGLLQFDPEWQALVRGQWLRMMEISVWGDLKGGGLGAAGKLRKRVLDLGEKWRSLFNDRRWIPQPRERLKNALGSAMNLRDSLLMVEKAGKEIEGGADYAEFERLLVAAHREIVGALRERENVWAAALDSLNRDSIED